MTDDYRDIWRSGLCYSREYIDVKGDYRTDKLIQRVESWVRKSVKPFRIIDLGGGTGELAEQFARTGAHVAVVDFSDLSKSQDIFAARNHRLAAAGLPPMQFHVADITR